MDGEAIPPFLNREPVCVRRITCDQHTMMDCRIDQRHGQQDLPY